MIPTRPVYDCDTSGYWTSEEEYEDRGARFGSFLEGGAAYGIDTIYTPRPWLNYLCNETFASAVSNNGMGFSWYATSLLRVTRYEHIIDYLPRTFEDGRIVEIVDRATGEMVNPFLSGESVRCVHRPGLSTILSRVADGITAEMAIFVPREDPGECWIVTLRNSGSAALDLEVRLRQVWCFARFGIHTAEEGIPYLSTPGEDQKTWTTDQAAFLRTTNPELPFPMEGVFLSPDATAVSCEEETSTRRDGRTFHFPVAELTATVRLEPGASQTIHVFSGASRGVDSIAPLAEKYAGRDVYTAERGKVLEERGALHDRLRAEVPSESISNFLNVWLKNQLYLTFRFVRSGLFGFRDTLQDTWGYTLLDPAMSRRFLLRTLSHVRRDGVCPRNYSLIDDSHDLRAFMDSGSWIAQTLVDYIKETGDFAVLSEPIPWLDSSSPSPAIDHVHAALDLLYEKRGRHGLCLVGDGDWNDALEGISRGGEAVSAWLTMALFHAQNLMAELSVEIGDSPRATIYRDRSAVLRDCLNTHAWDGEWYVYGFTGSGNPIGSSRNREGRIHLNAQTWAIFTGLADADRIATMRASIRRHLETPFGPALLAPPYVEEAAEVGRIARLEPGTFENGSVYMHAAAFAIHADLIAGFPEDAVETFEKLLPTNPENFDARRTSEPYCTGNYYCGPGHPRAGQNFFTWFTGNAAWLLRSGFDQMLGLQADFHGLRVKPSVPAEWTTFSARRVYRGQAYNFTYQRTGKSLLLVDGKPLGGNLIPAPAEIRETPVEVVVEF